VIQNTRKLWLNKSFKWIKTLTISWLITATKGLVLVNDSSPRVLFITSVADIVGLIYFN